MTELDKLEQYLNEHHYLIRRIDDNHSPIGIHQIRVYNKETGMFEWDAICHYGSFGYKQGLLEVMGIITTEEVEGYLTAADIIERLEKCKK